MNRLRKNIGKKFHLQQPQKNNKIPNYKPQKKEIKDYRRWKALP
jgi:hypothetical protein